MAGSTPESVTAEPGRDGLSAQAGSPGEGLAPAGAGAAGTASAAPRRAVVSPARETWRRFARHRMAMASLFVLRHRVELGVEIAHIAIGSDNAVFKRSLPWLRDYRFNFFKERFMIVWVNQAAQ